MIEREAVHVLAVCASYDGRKPSTVDAQTWAYELKSVERDAAVDAVREFYRVNPDGRIKPGHVLDILKTARKDAVSQSSRLEFELLRSIDPEAPDYDQRVQEALLKARSAPAENPAAIPARNALPGHQISAEDRAVRARRGNDRIRDALAKATPFRIGREDAPEVPENLRKAREVATQYRAGQAYRDKSMKLGRPGAELLKQINHQRAVAREGGTDGRP